MIIIAVVKNLMIRVGSDASGMHTGLKKAQKGIQDFKTKTNTSLKGIVLSYKSMVAGVTASLAALGVGAAVKSAMDVEAAMGQIGRTMGSSSQAFTDWAKNSAIAFNMGRSDAIKYGAVYSNLISGFTKDTKTVMTRTQDLLKASAVVASSTGRSMEDTMERIRSGMLGNTESIEDLGININVAMIESTDAFKRFANGRHWDQIDFQTQQQIRLFAILEQSTRKYGDAVANNTNSRQQQFIAQLKNVRLALGDAFLPIWNAVLPALTSLAASLASVMNIVAQFMGALFGKADVAAQTDATVAQAGAVGDLGDAYKTAGKKASGAVAGFDEVNQMQLADAGGGGSGGGGFGGPVAIDTGAANGLAEVGKKTEEIAQKVREAAEKVKEVYGKIKIEAMKLWEALKPFAEWLGGEYKRNWGILGNTLEWIWKHITIPMAKAELWLWNEVLAPFGKWLGSYFVGFWNGVGDAMKWVWDKVLVPVGGAFKWLWDEVLKPFGSWLGGYFVGFWNGVGKAMRGLWDNVLVPIGGAFKLLWNEVLVPFGKWLSEKFVAAWDAVKTAASNLWKTVLVPFGESISKIWKDVLKPFGAWVGETFVTAWNNVKAAVNTVWKSVFVPFGDFLKKMWDEKLKPFGTWLTEVFAAAWGGVKDAANAVWKNVLEPFGVFLKKFWDEILKPFATWLSEKFVAAFDLVGSAAATMKTTVVGVWDSITGAIKTAWDWLTKWNGTKAEDKKVTTTVTDASRAEVSSTPGPGGKYVTTPFTMPKMPKFPPLRALATGGITNGPMMALIGDNAGGREVVSPLDDLQDMIASAVGTAVMAASQMFGGNGQSQGDIVLKIDGSTFARVTGPWAEKERSRIGGSLITSS